MGILHVAAAASLWIVIFVLLLFIGTSLGVLAIIIWLIHVLTFTRLLSPYSSEDIDAQLEQFEDDCLHKHLKIQPRHLNEKLACGGIQFQLHTLHLPSICPGSQTLVLVHGTAGSSLSFVNVIEQLHSDFNVLVIDLPGFGRSHVDSSYTEIARLYEDDSADFYCAVLEAFLSSNKISETYLCGHSFGGYICTRYAVTHPLRVSGLILISPAGLFPTLGGFGAYWACVFKFSLPNLGRYLGRVGYLLMTRYLKNYSEGLYWYYILGHPRGIGDLFVRDKITLSPLGAYWNSPIFDDLAQIMCPLLLVYGEYDPIMPPHQGMVTQQIYSRFALEVIESSGHSPMDTATGARDVTEAIRRFLLVAQHSTDSDQVRPMMLPASEYKSSFSRSMTFATIAKLYRDIGVNGLDAEQVEAMRRPK
jgi:pimeloyl-ACP methyl ester carboxylesterase